MCTPEEVRLSFVEAFPSSATRETRFNQWLRHRDALRNLIPITAQWVDGSFVEQTADPRDIDVVTVYDGILYDALPPKIQEAAATMLDASTTSHVWGCDSMALAVYPPDHLSGHYWYQQLTWLYEYTFSHARQGLEPKGYLEIR